MRLRIQRTLLQLLHRQGFRFLGIRRRLIVLPLIERSSRQPGIGLNIFRVHTALAAIRAELRLGRRKIVLRQSDADVVHNARPCRNGEPNTNSNRKDEGAKTHAFMMILFPKGGKPKGEIHAIATYITSPLSNVYELTRIKSVAFSGHFRYNQAAFDFRVTSQYKSPLNPARDLPAEDPKVSALTLSKGTKQQHGNRNSEVV